MSGIYIHIPFCKQACHYCDFHFSTSMKKKGEMVAALAKEIVMRRDELGDEAVETIYFGGGTPSVLTSEELDFLIDAVYANFQFPKTPKLHWKPIPMIFRMIESLSCRKADQPAQHRNPIVL
jgi:oxygen-independent coproporphyrinogen-3 oxidase